MKIIQIIGGKPLFGSVKISGSKNSALKLVHAAMLSNEDVYLENVPKINSIESNLEVIRAIGGTADWSGPNKLKLNGSKINTHIIPLEIGSKTRSSALLAAALLNRFGKASLPIYKDSKISFRKRNRWIQTWQDLGIEVREDSDFIHLVSSKITASNISFKTPTHTGTDNAILSASVAEGETVISNAAQEPEIDDLIKLINQMGGEAYRQDDKQIVVKGTKIYKGAKLRVQPDRNEAVTFAVATLVTGGNVNIINVTKSHLLSFTSFLTNIGAQFEFEGDMLKIWASGDTLSSADIKTAPWPGIMTDWQPFVTLLLTFAEGESTIHETIYINRLSYIKDLNMMGAKIDLMRPSDAGLEAVISDDYYDIKKLGEPFTVAKVNGPTSLKGAKTVISNLRSGAALILAGLAAEGKTELKGFDIVERGYENFDKKLSSLGGRVEVIG